MYKVTAYFKEGKAFNYFKNVYDAIDFKDDMDAHYSIRTDLKKVKNYERICIYKLEQCNECRS